MKKSKKKSVPQKFRVLDLFTSGKLCEMFRCQPLCIRMWRIKRGLPFVKIVGDGRDNIRFDREEVLVWAKANNKRVFLVKRHAKG